MNAFSKALVIVASSLVGSMASANMIGSVNVGSVDLFKAEINKTDLATLCGSGGNETNELCWINSVLAPTSVTYEVKSTDVSYQLVTGSTNLIGYELTSPTEYFMIKNSTWWALFENQSNFDWAVIDTDQLNAGFNLPESSENDPWVISHVATIGNTVTVPEPGTLALFGLGLVAMAMKRRLSNT